MEITNKKSGRVEVKPTIIIGVYFGGVLSLAVWKEWAAYVNETVNFGYVVFYPIFCVLWLVISVCIFFGYKSWKQKATALFILSFIIATFFYAPNINLFKMKLRAEAFSHFPGLCQHALSVKTSTSICYHYAWNPSFGGIEDEDWLLFDGGNVLSIRGALWPEKIKRLLVGNFVKKIPISSNCMFEESQNLAPKMYWVHNGCTNNRPLNKE